MSYENDLVAGFWRHVQSEAGIAELLEEPEQGGSRPPVFAAEHAVRNVLCTGGVSSDTFAALMETLPKEKHHKWFRSMSSSQALAQSVFGNLKVHGGLALLEDMEAESGEPLIGAKIESAQLEYPVDYLGEKPQRETNIDVLLRCEGGYRLAFECKLRESEVGACSRPDVPEMKRSKTGGLIKNPDFDRDHCDGTYSTQHNRTDRCSLTGIGIEYWSYVPELFGWSSDIDHNPCPLRYTYQLARNVMAVSVEEDGGKIDCEIGHVALIYDKRNPAFQRGGAGDQAYQAAQTALRRKNLLRRCSWQAITLRLRASSSFRWLGDALHSKYGF